MTLPSPQDFLNGITLLVDKPKGWTSFDVVNKIRFALRRYTGDKKIKVGHAGTLDPMATGLLVICTGKSTKLLHEYQGFSKVYTGTILLGATTPSYDLETEIDARFPTEHLTPELLETTRQQFLGEIAQLPPMYSAIKVEGEALYKKARKGESIELQPRQIRIDAFDLSPAPPGRILPPLECHASLRYPPQCARNRCGSLKRRQGFRDGLTVGLPR